MKEMEALEINWKEKIQNLDEYYKSYMQNKTEDHIAETNKTIQKLEKQMQDDFERQMSITKSLLGQQIKALQDEKDAITKLKNQEIE